jgi:hypothetical protein
VSGTETFFAANSLRFQEDAVLARVFTGEIYPQRRVCFRTRMHHVGRSSTKGTSASVTLFSREREVQSDEEKTGLTLGEVTKSAGL